MEQWNGLPGMIVEALLELGPGPGPGARAGQGWWGDVLDWGPDCPPWARAGGGHSLGTIPRGKLSHLIPVAFGYYVVSDIESTIFPTSKSRLKKRRGSGVIVFHAIRSGPKGQKNYHI